MNFKHHLILASNSPRRQQLLKELGIDFKVFTRDFDEEFPADLDAHQVAEYLAVQKNHNYRPLKPEALIITSDTTVICERTVLNKPKDKSEAIKMLTMLSSKTHEVVSGVCIAAPEKEISFSDTTSVTFEEISPVEMEYYIDNYRPFDKAGAYGIQEWIGMTKISSIKGSYFTVMGLPIHKVYQVLNDEFAQA